MIFTKTIFSLTLLTVLLQPSWLLAGTSVVTNSVSVSANSGTTQSNGDTKTETRIITTINGQTVTDIHEVSTEGDIYNITPAETTGTNEIFPSTATYENLFAQIQYIQQLITELLLNTSPRD